MKDIWNIYIKNKLSDYIIIVLFDYACFNTFLMCVF